MAATALALTVPTASIATDGQQTGPSWPQQIDLTEAGTVRDFTAGIEEPALDILLEAIQDMGPPDIRQGAPAKIDELIRQPKAHRGRLLRTSGQFWEAKRLSLIGSDRPAKRSIWSTMIWHAASGRTTQILTLAKPADFARLEKVSCIGYFYKARRERSAKPDQNGRTAMITVPVLVGWIVLPEPTPASKPTSPPWQLVVPVTVLALAILLTVKRLSRRRTDWKSRLGRPRATASDEGNSAEQE